jgi:hypothetical protein
VQLRSLRELSSVNNTGQHFALEDFGARFRVACFDVAARALDVSSGRFSVRFRFHEALRRLVVGSSRIIPCVGGHEEFGGCKRSQARQSSMWCVYY